MLRAMAVTTGIMMGAAWLNADDFLTIGQKIVVLERGTSHQAAVDIGLGEQLGGVAGIQARPMEETQPGGQLRVRLRLVLAAGGYHLLGLLRRGGTRGADGPHAPAADHDEPA